MSHEIRGIKQNSFVPDLKKTAQIPQQAPSRRRWLIALLLFVTVVINYLDRSNLSIVAPELMRELSISPVQAGWIFSAFGWTYAAMQIPGGWLVDRVRPRYLYALALASWSLATVSMGFVGSFAAMFGLRLMVGALEAPAYPINSRVVTTWSSSRPCWPGYNIGTAGTRSSSEPVWPASYGP
jgi:ACS family D-galactonate transporter-like MFS transporter